MEWRLFGTSSGQKDDHLVRCTSVTKVEPFPQQNTLMRVTNFTRKITRRKSMAASRVH